MLASFDKINAIVTIGDKLTSREVCHRIPYDWWMYNYYGSLVTVWYCLSLGVFNILKLSRNLEEEEGWYAVICCNGTLHFLPYHPLSHQKAQMQLGDLGKHCKVPQRGSGHSPGCKHIYDIFWSRKTCLVTFWFFLCGPKRGNWSESSPLAFSRGTSVPLSHACWRPCVNMPI